MAAGEVMWAGIEPLGERDGRVALYLTDHMRRLRPPNGAGGAGGAGGGRAALILDYLHDHGASFFAAIHEGTGGGFPNETVDALWELVWKGLITNDTLHALRAYGHAEQKRGSSLARAKSRDAFRSRRLVPRKAEGRWSVIATAKPTRSSATEWSAAQAQQMLSRHGVVTRETVATEAVAGGFSAVYQVLKAMEDAGRIRRGYFVAGLGAAQFAMPAALDLLRSLREPPDTPRTVVMAATDPANPYGTMLKWPTVTSEAGDRPNAPVTDTGRGPTRSVGALVILVDGLAAGYLRRGERELLLFAPPVEPRRSQIIREVARMLLYLAGSRDESRRGMLIAEINGDAATSHPAARIFIEEGFAAGALGLQARLLREGHGASGAGTRIAGRRRGGNSMAEPRDDDQDILSETGTQRERETSDVETAESEHDRVRASNDLDQNLEREGVSSRQNRGYDEAVRGGGSQNEPTDPDSPAAENDRDDTVDE
jgi:ATP-dependent Lhr-like helicase